MTIHCVSCRIGSLHLLDSSYGILENICTKFSHNHINDSTSACIIHFIYILVLELAQMKGAVFGQHCSVL